MKELSVSFKGKKIPVRIWDQGGKAKLYSAQIFCPECGYCSKSTHYSTETKAKTHAFSSFKKHHSKKH